MYIIWCQSQIFFVIGTDTPLPDLNIIVNDGDTSKNAEYDLVIQDIKNAEGVFTVYPQRAIGR